jgi:hypothetical protein
MAKPGMLVFVVDRASKHRQHNRIDVGLRQDRGRLTKSVRNDQLGLCPTLPVSNHTLTGFVLERIHSRIVPGKRIERMDDRTHGRRKLWDGRDVREGHVDGTIGNQIGAAVCLSRHTIPCDSAVGGSFRRARI